MIIDDFPLVREGYVSALSLDPDIEVVAEAQDGKEGLASALEHQPDVAIVDLYMPENGGIPLIEKLREQLPETRVLVVSASERSESVLDAIAAGAAGYVSKRAGQEELRQAVITVHGGGGAISPDLATHVLRGYSGAARGEAPAKSLLTSREQEVLRLVADGMTDREIGAELNLSPRTVQNHLASVRARTGLRRRSELVKWAIRHAAI